MGPVSRTVSVCPGRPREPPVRAAPSAPPVGGGLAALDAEGPNRIGLGWFTLTRDGREVTWHNGGTGGSCSFIGIDRENGRGAVVLSNTN
ncbi:beta-lactamase family protein, partial [Streptomyces katsurahamanus]|nr:beta-lactamase family protein [Streptomyces katsurahamanus]